jgi:adenylate cyclase
MQEIERKFLVKTLPADLESYKSKEVEQFYISLRPEIRVRRAGDECFFTIKTGSGLTRQETELTITEIAYETLKAHAKGNIIHKTRYYIDLDCGLVVEVDIFHGSLAPLVMAEIEFPSEQEAKMFLPLSWFGKEVTYDEAYKNQSLAVRGLAAGL